MKYIGHSIPSYSQGVGVSLETISREQSFMHADSDAANSAEREIVETYPDVAIWRLQMFDFACMVVDRSVMDRSAVLATAFNILDRYTAFELKRPNSSPVTREDYQLFAMTSLYIAMKILEPFPRKMGVEAFSAISRDFYRAEDIASTELEMLGVLRWRTSPPTTIGFCRELIQFLMPDEKERGMDMEQIYPTICDVTISDPFFLDFPSSVIAVAALLHAARLTGRSRREQNFLKQSSVRVLGLGVEDKRELMELEVVYKKIGQLYF